MAIRLSVAVRNSRLDRVDAVIGGSPILRIRTGVPPAGGTADPDSGAVLATMNLPSTWMNPAAGGVKTKVNVWQDLSADAAGTAGHFRIYDTTGTTCHLQGTVTATGGGGDLTLDNIVIALAQSITITGFTLTDGNA